MDFDEKYALLSRYFHLQKLLYGSKSFLLVGKSLEDHLTQYEYVANRLYSEGINPALENKKVISRWKKSQRLKPAIAYMLNFPCIFLTFTFSDESLAYHPRYRAASVKSFLDLYSDLYVYNKDFGKLNGREHYHALIVADRVDYSVYKLGIINGERVRNCKSSEKRLRRYIAKITNHAVKDVTRGSRVVKSKGLKALGF